MNYLMALVDGLKIKIDVAKRKGRCYFRFRVTKMKIHCLGLRGEKPKPIVVSQISEWYENETKPHQHCFEPYLTGQYPVSRWIYFWIARGEEGNCACRAFRTLQRARPPCSICTATIIHGNVNKREQIATIRSQHATLNLCQISEDEESFAEFGEDSEPLECSSQTPHPGDLLLKPCCKGTLNQDCF